MSKEYNESCAHKKSWHAGCVKIPEDVYKVLSKLSSSHWFCCGMQ